MKVGGETVTLTSNYGGGVGGGGGGAGYGHGYANMLAGVMAPAQISLLPQLPLIPSSSIQQQPQQSVLLPPSCSNLSTSSISLAGLVNIGDELQQKDIGMNSTAAEVEQAKGKEDETESKSSSENMEGASGEDHEDPNPRPTKKRYHRHTLHQIAEMERVFKECPHPDEKQRQELSKELLLSPRQIKFWFQNKRTQMKAQHERQDNSVLRAENDKLKAENYALRDAVRHVSCPNCGGPATLAEMSFEEQQLRIENVRLREEIEKITAMAAKYIGRHIPNMAASIPVAPAAPTSSSPTGSSILDNNNSTGAGGLMVAASNEQVDMSARVPGPSVADIASRPFGLTDSEKPLVVELAVVALEELLQVAQASEPLWVPNPCCPSTASDVPLECIDHDVYVQRFPRGIGPTPPGLHSESTRHTGLVIMNCASLVETLMDTKRWADMFPSIISRVHTVEVLSTGIAGTYDGAIQLMYAEFQLPTPLVPTRENYFLRYSKRVDHLWVVVDVSIDSLRGNPPPSLLRCRRRPSGCVIEEMPSGYSKVTWVEHVEADSSGVHKLYKTFVECGMGFGAQRWLCTLQRQCERIASVLANNILAGAMNVPSTEGRRSMLKLAERMTNNFCGGVSASTSHTWVTLAGGSGANDVHVVIRKSVDDPGRPPGIVLSAATSLRLPVSPAKVFQFLRAEKYRTEWDILSTTGVVEEIFHVAKGQEAGNCVSLLRVNPNNTNQSNMLILQECCTDESCSLVVYAPVDIAEISAVLNGGDPDCVALLPSGFAILPDGPQSKEPSNGLLAAGADLGGTLLTVAFQILVDHVPTARLSLGSVATVNKLISNTVIRIKRALACDV